MIKVDREKIGRALMERGGWATRLLKKIAAGAHVRAHQKSRLELVDRIALAPRHSLALVEADGIRLLVATSHDGGPAFYALDSPPVSGSASRMVRPAIRRISVKPARMPW